MLHDLRYGMRGIWRNPAFALTAIVILAVGIGATSAIFSVVDRLLFRSLPYPDSETLVSVGMRHPILDGDFLVANDYLQLREQQGRPFTALTSWTGTGECDLTEANPLRLTCAQVESTFLPTFGVQPVSGRNFTADEDRRDAAKVALISYALWQARFGGDPRAVGRMINVDGAPVEIVGVLPRDFELPTLEKADLVLPQALAIQRFQPGQTGRPLRVFGRLKPGVSVERAREILRPQIIEFMRLIPAPLQSQASVALRSVRDFQIQDVKLASWALFASTVAILLIVCANVANLLLARATGRRKEFFIRQALGAGRGELTRQGLVESLLLSGIGAATGCGLAWTLLRVLKGLAPAAIPRIEQASIDWRVLGFTSALAVACGILLGIWPAFSDWRLTGGSRQSVRRTLSAAQIALSLMLLSDAGLLIESLRNMVRLRPGFNTEQVVTAEITVGTARYRNAVQRQKFFDDLTQRLRANPMVTAAAVSDTVPPSGFIHNRPFSGLQVAGRPAVQAGGGLVSWRRVSPEYFAALGIPILRGRGFREADRVSTQDAMVISATLARRLFPSEEPVGRVIHFGSGGDATVIGVVGDVDNAGVPGRSDPEYYVVRKRITDPTVGTDASLVTRALHIYDGQAVVIVRSAARPEAIAGWVRAETAAMDPTVPVTVATLAERVRGVSERPRFNAFLLSLFAAIAVALAAAGVYGLMSFLVAQRTREIGIRMAVGATPASVARLVVWDALRFGAWGIAVGLVGAVVTARWIEGILFQVKPVNPVMLAGAAAVLVAAAIVASLRPSLRAARVDPLTALRQE